MTPFKNFNIVFIALFALVFLISFSTGDGKTASIIARKLMSDILRGVVTLIFIGYCINYFKTKYLLSDPEVNVKIDAGDFVKTGIKFYLFGFFLGLYLIMFYIPVIILAIIAWGVAVSSQFALAMIIILVAGIIGIQLMLKLFKYILISTLRYLQTDNIKEGWNIKEINSIIKLNNKALESYLWIFCGLSFVFFIVIIFSAIFSLINAIFASVLLGMAMWYSIIVFYDMYGNMLNNLVMQPQAVE